MHHEHESQTIFNGTALEFQEQYPFLHNFFKKKVCIENVEISELQCAENSCPVKNTTFNFLGPKKMQTLVVARPIQNISKMDLLFSIEKQWTDHE